MKKAVSVLMSLALAAGSFMCAPALAAEQVTAADVPKENFKFIDLAYNDNGTLVAMAKDSTNNYSTGQMYYSDDYGETWQTAKNNPSGIGGACQVSALPETQQQLVWWEGQGVFVAKAAGNTYISADGITWKITDPDKALHWNSNTMITTNGEHLIYASKNQLRVADSVSELEQEYTASSAAMGANNYIYAIAAKPADETGTTEVFCGGQNIVNDFSFAKQDSGYVWNHNIKQTSGIPYSIYDMTYVDGADQFLFVDRSNALGTASPDSEAVHYIAITIKDGVNVTGVNANDKYIAVGMSDGTMYYTANEQITRETVWTQVPEMQSDEAIKNIEFIDDTNFVALGDTKIYKGSLIPGEEPGGPEVSVPALGETTTSGDGYFAKTGTFMLTPNGTAGINVKVTAGDQVQTKTIDAALETEVKLGIIIVSDDASKLESITPSVEITGADAE